MNVKNLITNYIQSNVVMQLATISNGAPQLCTVHYAVDEDLNFYWFSDRDSHHSQAIRVSNKAAVGVLHNIEFKQCVHTQGQAYIAVGDDVAKAHDYYSQRFGENPENLEQASSSDEKNPAYYIYKPEVMVLFDPIHFPNDPRQEINVRSW